MFVLCDTETNLPYSCHNTHSINTHTLHTQQAYLPWLEDMPGNEQAYLPWLLGKISLGTRLKLTSVPIYYYERSGLGFFILQAINI